MAPLVSSRCVRVTGISPVRGHAKLFARPALAAATPRQSATRIMTVMSSGTVQVNDAPRVVRSSSAAISPLPAEQHCVRLLQGSCCAAKTKLHHNYNLYHMVIFGVRVSRLRCYVHSEY